MERAVERMQNPQYGLYDLIWKSTERLIIHPWERVKGERATQLIRPVTFGDEAKLIRPARLIRRKKVRWPDGIVVSKRKPGQIIQLAAFDPRR